MSQRFDAVTNTAGDHAAIDDDKSELSGGVFKNQSPGVPLVLKRLTVT